MCTNGQQSSLQGIALAERYFHEAGLPLLGRSFPDLLDRMAAGLVAGGYDSGCGSEIGGFDDGISRDHNWGPRFFLFLNDDDFAAHGTDVQALLDAELPDEFAGFRTTGTTLPPHRAYVETPHRQLRHVLTLDGPPADDRAWLSIPEYLLFEYTAGRIFYEPTPLIAPLRQAFAYYPDQVWRKRLGYACFQLQAVGNVRRMADRRDAVAARIYLTWLLQVIMRTTFLLRRRYAPYHKWLFRAFRDLPDVPPALAVGVERLSLSMDLTTVVEDATALLDLLGEMLNGSGCIVPQPLRKPSPFIWTDFNSFGFMQAFEDTLAPPLAGHPYEGPLDLWVDHNDKLSVALGNASLWEA